VGKGVGSVKFVGFNDGMDVGTPVGKPVGFDVGSVLKNGESIDKKTVKNKTTPLASVIDMVLIIFIIYY
jgi:hypothetical protein